MEVNPNPHDMQGLETRKIILDSPYWREEITITGNETWRQLLLLVKSKIGTMPTFIAVDGIRITAQSLNPLAGDPSVITVELKSINEVMHDVCRYGNLLALRKWAATGVDILNQKFFGATTLITAVQHGHEPIVRELLHYGIDTDYLNYRDRNGRTAIDYARDFGIRNMLLEAGATASVMPDDE